MKRKEHTGSILSIRSFSALQKSIDSVRDRLILQILFETGCSVSDLSNVMAGDIRSPKEHTELCAIRFHNPLRFSAISSELSSHLVDYAKKRKRKKDEFLFSQQPDKPFSMKRIEQILFAISQEKKILITPHNIKYLHIREALSKGLSPDTIAAQTGLSRQRILQISDLLHITSVQSYASFFTDMHRSGGDEL
jgi:integrase